MAEAHFSKIYPSNPRREILDLVPLSARKALDVGCNTGSFGHAMKSSRDIEVWGIEPNKAAAQIAASVLDNVINDAFTETSELPESYIDVIFFNDVLEHISDPWSALRLAAAKLNNNGCVIASIPNMLHIDNLLHILLERDFRYEPLGIRDRTHLRFFTRLSAVRMFEECGYEVVVRVGINESWYSPSLVRRIAYRLFRNYLNETKYIQFAFVAILRS